MEPHAVALYENDEEVDEERENFMSELYRLSRMSPSEFSHVKLSQEDLMRYMDYIISNEVDSMSERQWTTLLELSLKNRNSTLSNMIFGEMANRNLPCNSVHMMGLLSQRDHDKAYEMWQTALSLGMQPSVHNFSPLLKKSNSTTRTRELLQQMDYYCIEPNVITLTAAIKSCESTGDWKFALDLLDLMRATDILPNEITYSCAISVCSNGAAGNIALNILREMQHLGVNVNMITYASALVACARSSLWEDVHRLLAEMEMLGIPIQESVLISVINVCRDTKFPSVNNNLPKWKRAVEFMDKYASKVPDPTESLYTIVMDVCEGANQPSEVVNTFKKMINRKIKGTKSAFSFIIRACSKLNNVHLALEIIHDYIRVGGCSTYMIEDASILAAELDELEVAVKVLTIASSGTNNDRPISSRIVKKVVSQALEFYNFTRKMNVEKQMTLGSHNHMDDHIDEFEGGDNDKKTVKKDVGVVTSSYVDTLLDFLRPCIEGRTSQLLLTISAREIAKKILIENNEENLAKKLDDDNVLLNDVNSRISKVDDSGLISKISGRLKMSGQ